MAIPRHLLQALSRLGRLKPSSQIARTNFGGLSALRHPSCSGAQCTVASTVTYELCANRHAVGLQEREAERGRGPSIALGLAAQLIGIAFIAFAQSIEPLLAGGFFFALGSSMIGSTATALAMDLTNPQTRGRGMATFSISYQIGAGLGAIVAGSLADTLGLRAMYFGSIAITLVGFAILAGSWKRLPVPRSRVG